MAAFIQETSLLYDDFVSDVVDSVEVVITDSTLAAVTTNEANADYSSSFITGPKVRGSGQQSQKVEYITVFANVTDDGSLYVRGRWDWADDSSTGKWSTEQQAYTVNRPYRDVSRKRILMRGSGPAIQLQFRSETGKPFDLIGWTMFESIDGTP